jgi:hypothetical protein
VFLPSCRNLVEFDECRGTSLISGRKVVMGAEVYKMGTGAVSRYKIVKWAVSGHVMQVCSNAQRRVSGFIPNCLVVMDAGAVCKNRDKSYLLY